MVHFGWLFYGVCQYEIIKNVFFPKVDTISAGSKFFCNERVYVITN